MSAEPRLKAGDRVIPLTDDAADVFDFQDRQRRNAEPALAEMVADSQQLGDYDDDPAVVRALARRIRHGR